MEKNPPTPVSVTTSGTMSGDFKSYDSSIVLSSICLKLAKDSNFGSTVNLRLPQYASYSLLEKLLNCRVKGDGPSSLISKRDVSSVGTVTSSAQVAT